MTQGRATWTEVLRALGEAMLDVLRAELAVLGADWKRFGRQLAVGSALVVGALFFVFWLVPLVLFTAVSGLAQAFALQLWVASAIVALAVLLAIAGLGAVAYFGYFRKLVDPVTASRRRLEDHLNWWRERFLPQAPQLQAGDSDEDQQRESPGAT